MKGLHHRCTIHSQTFLNLSTGVSERTYKSSYQFPLRTNKKGPESSLKYFERYMMHFKEVWSRIYLSIRILLCESKALNVVGQPVHLVSNFPTFPKIDKRTQNLSEVGQKCISSTQRQGCIFQTDSDCIFRFRGGHLLQSCWRIHSLMKIDESPT